MPIPLDALLVATGFTGALTLVWLVRLVRSCFVPPVSLSAHFSPGGGCLDVVVRELGAARREALLLATDFTARPIAQALVDAKLRGVHVEVILDRAREADAESQLSFLVEQGLLPLLDAEHADGHNNLVVIDGKTVLTGSFAFTTQAEASASTNLVVLREHADLAQAFQAEFHQHKAHAKAVAGQPTSKPDDSEECEEEEETPDDGSAAPVVTPAAAELFARLRQELAEGEEEKKAG